MQWKGRSGGGGGREQEEGNEKEQLQKVEKTYGNSLSITMSIVEEALALSRIYIQRTMGAFRPSLVSSMLRSKVAHLIENYNGVRKGRVPHMKNNKPF